MMIGNETGKWERARAVDGVKGEGGTGAEKTHRSEEGDLVPDRKGMGEVGVSKMVMEVGEKTATPWGRIRGEIPRRELDKAESGRKYAETGKALLGKDSSPVMCEGPPTSKTEQSEMVKRTRGKGLCVKKELRAGKFENWRRKPVQPVSAMMGGAEIVLSA